MITFFPGPSKVYSQTGRFLQDAFQEGILSISHRSDTFTSISRRAIELMQEKLHVPADYTIMFTTSATESWEILAQSLIRNSSVHAYNGSFGEKWYLYTQKLIDDARGFAFDINETLKPESLPVTADTEMICLTHNETSTATRISNEVLFRTRALYPDPLIAIDATSSMAGVVLPFEAADVWYASVQKCFGMPAGLGILICSPKAILKMQEIGEKKHYNSLISIYENIQNWQTTFTPNVLNIYLLMRIMEMVPDITETEKRLTEQANNWYQLIHGLDKMSLLIHNPEVQSHTVVAVKSDPEFIKDIKLKAKEAGMLLGSGYGTYKESTFRIANFPAIEMHEIAQLAVFLKGF